MAISRIKCVTFALIASFGILAITAVITMAALGLFSKQDTTDPLSEHLADSLNNISVYPTGSYSASVSSFSNAPISSSLLPLNRSTLEEIVHIDNSSFSFEAGRQQFVYFRLPSESANKIKSSTESNTITGVSIHFGNQNKNDLVTIVPLYVDETHSQLTPGVTFVFTMDDGSRIFRIELNSPSSMCSLDGNRPSDACVTLNYDARSVTDDNKISSPLSNDANVACGDVCSLSSTQCLASCTTCNGEQVAGADTPVSRRYNMGSKAARFKFDYNTYTIKDRIKVWNGAILVFDSGCVGASDTITLGYSSDSSDIRVDVEPNCACSDPGGCTGTVWDFTVNCPNVCDITQKTTAGVFLQSETQQVNDNTVLYIDQNALMPPLLAGSCMNDVSVSWKVNFTYRAAIKNPVSFPSFILNGYSSLNSPFDIKAALGNAVYGGSVVVTWTYQQQSGQISFKVLGTEPNDSDLMNYIKNSNSRWYARKVARQESFGGNQFLRDGSGYPLVSPDNGYGVYQLTNPVPDYSQLFNWKANVDEGVYRLRLKQSEADSWMARQRLQANGIPVPDEIVGNCHFTDSNISDAVAIKLYNGASLGYYCAWDNANNKWKFNRVNNFNRSYVSDVCHQLD